MRGIGLLVLWSICLGGLLPAQESKAVRTVEIASLINLGGGMDVVFFRPPCGGGSLVEPDPEVVEPVPEEALLRLLQGVAGESQVEVVEGRAILSGEAGAVARAAGLAEGLVQSLGRPVVLQAWWIDPGEAPPAHAAVLGPEEVAALQKGFRPGGSMRLIGEARFQVALGGAGHAEKLDALNRLARYEAEVASKSMIAHPAMDPLVSGERLRLRASPAPGGRVALFFEAWRVSAPSVRRVVVGTPRVPWVEPASAEGLLIAGSALLGRGEALLVRHQDRQRSTWVLVQLQEVPAAMDGLVCLGPLFLPWHRGLMLPIPPWQESDSRGWGSQEEETGGAPLSEELFDRLAGGMGLIPRVLLPAGALFTGGAWRPDLFQRLAGGLAMDKERPVQVEILVKGVPGARAEGMDAEAILRKGELLRHLAFPVLVGRRGLFLAGTELQYVQAYEVEVAEKAALAVPVLGSAWSGLTGLVEAGGSGLKLALRHHWAGEPESVPTEAKDLGPVERVRCRRAGLDGEWAADGRLYLLGEGASQGEGEGLWRVAVGLVAR